MGTAVSVITKLVLIEIKNTISPLNQNLCQLLFVLEFKPFFDLRFLVNRKKPMVHFQLKYLKVHTIYILFFVSIACLCSRTLKTQINIGSKYFGLVHTREYRNG